MGCSDSFTRWLEDGTLPILATSLVDGDVTYTSTSFVTLEKSSLKPGALHGTHYLVADSHAIGHSFTDEQ